jgi:hypothetical protein
MSDVVPTESENPLVILQDVTETVAEKVGHLQFNFF